MIGIETAQPLDEEALAALMKGVEEHKAAAEKHFSEGASRDAGQRRALTKSGAPARRRAAGRGQESTEEDEVRNITSAPPLIDHRRPLKILCRW